MLFNYFLFYALTIVVVRVWLWLFPKHGPKFFGFRPHHYAYGLVLMVFSFFIFRSVLLPVGAALFIDEVPLFFIFKGLEWPDNHWKQYQSWQSLAGVAALSLIGFAFLFYS